MKIFIKILKSIIFYPMLWLRGLFKLGFKIISVIFLLGGIIFLIIGSEEMGMENIILAFVGSFVFFIIGMLYDQILLKLNPTGNDLTLSI